MKRQFQQLLLDKEACAGLREAIRPLVSITYSPGVLIDLCRRLYLMFYALEADPERETIDLPVNIEEIMVINQFLSPEDGTWAVSVLQQTRKVLYELTTQKSAMKLSFSSDVQKLFPEKPKQQSLEKRPEEVP